MSDNPAGTGDVTQSTAEAVPVESATPVETAPAETEAAGPPVEAEAVEAGTPAKGEIIRDAIARLEAESKEARTVKDTADSRFADADGRLTALRNLQKDVDTATVAYEAAFDQLKIDQRVYLDYQLSEKESLENLLGPLKDTVKEKSEAGQVTLKDADAAVEVKRADVQKAQQVRDDLDRLRKSKDAEVKAIKQLAVTISARHSKLKSVRDEVTKAEQAGNYALAYWLLEFRDYNSVINGQPKLIEPSDLEAALLAAVNALADAEKDYAAGDSALGRAKNALSEAESFLADRKAKGEADLREELKKLAPAKS